MYMRDSALVRRHCFHDVSLEVELVLHIMQLMLQNLLSVLVAFTLILIKLICLEVVFMFSLRV